MERFKLLIAGDGMQSSVLVVLLLGSIGLAETRTAQPELFPKPGKYDSHPSVSIKDHTDGAVIHYTLNASEPDENSPVYTGPILISSTTTVRAIAVAAGMSSSKETQGEYQIQGPPSLGSFAMS